MEMGELWHTQYSWMARDVRAGMDLLHWHSAFASLEHSVCSMVCLTMSHVTHAGQAQQSGTALGKVFSLFFSFFFSLSQSHHLLVAAAVDAPSPAPEAGHGDDVAADQGPERGPPGAAARSGRSRQPRAGPPLRAAAGGDADDAGEQRAAERRRAGLFGARCEGGGGGRRRQGGRQRPL